MREMTGEGQLGALFIIVGLGTTAMDIARNSLPISVFIIPIGFLLVYDDERKGQAWLKASLHGFVEFWRKYHRILSSFIDLLNCKYLKRGI